jgi:hypothetical protein
MNAKDILTHGATLVSTDRQDQHGDMVEHFTQVSGLWSIYLDAQVKPEDVPMMMALLKISRSKHGSLNLDDYVDGAAYIGCAGEVTQRRGNT